MATGIEYYANEGYVPLFEEWAAAKAANLDLWLWEHHDHYPAWFKERVVAHYRLERAVANHVEDARNRAK